MHETIEKQLLEHKSVLEKTTEILAQEIEKASILAVETIQSGNKIMFCGNGGSASDAQHLAAELSGRFVRERKGLPGLALTTDASVLTSVSNDFGFEFVFSRQVEAIASKGDLLIGISTSGNSANVINALKMAKKLGCKTLGFSGNKGGKFSGECDLNLIVPSDVTARIQEMHILIGHIICQAIDDAFC
ncbi:MAG: D-sedoheptulose 7-phosphate isomerase [Calditrichaeota bacterium]|nr:MAG: D-sedoheptulose 7-phosphate isomerase [Calditrichota bacterium]MBL1203887.1 D-sedoheptulose 7-phosphate isomerase [Calditrichota bacterium]NOG43719.1 D-sedoheptulose 7-phosphate isomerase [Calditrichota bacterium]